MAAPYPFCHNAFTNDLLAYKRKVRRRLYFKPYRVVRQYAFILWSVEQDLPAITCCLI